MSTTTTISSQATTEWVKIFPRTVANSYTSSVTFMKQLTVIAISTVSYLKDIFPEDSYTVESFGGYKIRILKDKCSNEIAQFVSTSLKQAFEAFDKQYLEKLALCFYNGSHEADNLIEYYLFEYTYNRTGVTMDVHSKIVDSPRTSARYTFDNIRDKTVLLIKTCVIMAEASKKIDLSVNDISLRLYYNENAPEDYQAPGFLPTVESEDHLERNVGTINAKSVETPYHRLRMHAYLKDLANTSQEVFASDNAPKISDDIFYGLGADTYGKSAQGPSKMAVQCVCNNNDKDDFDPSLLIMCNYCTTYQHAICYGICRSDVSRVYRHCCAACHDKDPTREPTDIKFAKSVAKQRESFSILRRTLDWCCQVQALSVNDLVHLFRISQLSAVKLMKILDYNGIVARDPEANITTPRKIMPEQLNSAIQKYFQTEKYNIVDRLVAESLSQEQCDPVGDMLGPFEKTNLKNATTLGRVVDVDEPRDTAEDATLKRYREAILLHQENDQKLALNGSQDLVRDVSDKKAVKRKSTSDKFTKSGIKTKKLRETSK